MGEWGSAGESDTIPAPNREESQMQDALRRLPILTGLSRESLEDLGRSMSRLKREEGELLFSEGEACRGLYLVESGNVRVFRALGDGREYTIDLLGPDEPTPLVAFLDGGALPASAEALEHSVLLFLPRAPFVRIAREHPQVLERAIAILCSRLRDAHGRETELALHTVHERIASALLRLQRDHPGGVPALSHEDLAHLVGAARETVTRALHDMARQGAVEVGRSGTVIKDAHRLGSWLESS